MSDGIHARLAARLGAERLELLQRKRVGMIGLGLLGGQQVLQAAMARIPMLLVDCGAVETPNLGNSLLPRAAVGRSKAAARARQVAAIDPSCPVRALHARVEDLGLGAFADCDLLLTGLDGRRSRLAVNRIAQRLGIDWIDAAVDGGGEQLAGTVSYYRPFLGTHACGACRYGAADLVAIGREGRGTGCPSWRDASVPVTPPTLSAAPFGAVVAGLQMLWAMRALLGDADGLVNRQLQLCATDLPRTRVVELARGAQCSFPHARLELRHADCATVGDLVERAALELSAAPAELRFPDRQLALGLVCGGCGQRRDLVRSRTSFGDEDVRCPLGCAGEMVPLALGDRLDAARLRRLLGTPWEELGLPDGEHVTACAAGKEVHYLVRPTPREGAS